MEINSLPESVRGREDLFTGEVWFETLVRAEPPSYLRANIVHFAPSARSAWHAHALGQTLHITEGVGRVQARGGEVIEVRAGDTVYTPPGEWHWHGAAPEHFMTHVGTWEAPADGPETEWGGLVTDGEYDPR